MKICGLDLSMNSSGLVSFHLDENLNPISKEYMGFAPQKKKSKPLLNCVPYDKDNLHPLEKDIFICEKIIEFVNGSDFVAMEGYSYGSKGNTFEIGQFTGSVKYELIKNKIPFRIYDPTTIKMYATGSGNADKLEMYQSFLSLNDDMFNIDKLPTVYISKGKSPTSDIIDAYFICCLLLLELKLRKGFVTIKELPENDIKIFNRVTKENPVNILAQDFIERKIK